MVASSKQLMLVHGNWTYTGKHHVTYGKNGFKDFRSWNVAKKFANNKAKLFGVKTYPVHQSTGDVKWVATKK